MFFSTTAQSLLWSDSYRFQLRAVFLRKGSWLNGPNCATFQTGEIAAYFLEEAFHLLPAVFDLLSLLGNKDCRDQLPLLLYVERFY